MASNDPPPPPRVRGQWPVHNTKQTRSVSGTTTVPHSNFRPTSGHQDPASRRNGCAPRWSCRVLQVVDSDTERRPQDPTTSARDRQRAAVLQELQAQLRALRAHSRTLHTDIAQGCGRTAHAHRSRYAPEITRLVIAELRAARGSRQKALWAVVHWLVALGPSGVYRCRFARHLPRLVRDCRPSEPSRLFSRIHRDLVRAMAQVARPPFGVRLCFVLRARRACSTCEEAFSPAPVSSQCVCV